MYIVQKQLESLRAVAQPGKVAVLYSARRTGKTTLRHEFLEKVNPPTEWQAAYPEAAFALVNQENYLEFVGAASIK